MTSASPLICVLHCRINMLQVQYIECLDRARLATNFNASAPFLKCSALPPTQTSQLQPQQSRLVTERVLELDELSVVGPKPVRVSPVMEEESESDTASEVSELPTDEEEEEAKSEKGEERVKIINPEEKDEDLSEGEFRKEDSENVLTVNREVDSSDKEDASDSTNSEDSVREIRVKAVVEREDSCNDDEPVEDVLQAEEVKQGEADPSLNEAVSEVEEEDRSPRNAWIPRRLRLLPLLLTLPPPPHMPHPPLPLHLPMPQTFPHQKICQMPQFLSSSWKMSTWRKISLRCLTPSRTLCRRCGHEPRTEGQFEKPHWRTLVLRAFNRALWSWIKRRSWRQTTGWTRTRTM